MKEFLRLELDWRQAAIELGQFATLLASRHELDERKDLLPFFRAHQQLCLLLGLFNADMVRSDLLAFEYPLYGDFCADIVIGDSANHAFCFVELEDARRTTLFKKTKLKTTPEWSSRFLHGFGQIVDWFWKLHDSQASEDFALRFGSRQARFLAILMAGRSQGLNERENLRLQWWTQNVTIAGKHIVCSTLDEICARLQKKLEVFQHERRLR